MNLSTSTIASSPDSVIQAVGPRDGEFLSFRLGDVEYAIGILKVQEIRGYEKPTRMVGTSEAVKGVSNLRGTIVPIVDLRLKFGLPSASYGAQTITVILTLGDRVVGAVVDSVHDVVAVSNEQIKAMPPIDSSIDPDCFIGIASMPQGDSERMLILLDIDKLMASPSMGLGPEQLTLQ